MDHMIANAKDDAERLFYLSREITLIEGAFFRQVMFAAFEQQMYQAAFDGGTRTSDDLDARFKKVYAKIGADLTSDSHLDPFVEKYRTLLAEAKALL